MRLHRTAVTFGLALAATACSPTGEVGEPIPTADDTRDAARFGLVVLTHQAGEPGVAVSGQLLSARGPTRATALHALTQPEQTWLALAATEPGTCRMIRTEHGALPAGSSIDLLSAGELTVSAPGRRDTPFVLPPRDFPPISFGVNGVVYDGEAPEVLPYRPGGLYQIAAPGDELGPIGGAIVAPGAIDVESHSFDDDGLTVRWQGDDALVIVSRDTGSDTVGLVCQPTDTAVRIDPDALALLGPGDAQLVVARVRRAPLLVDGLSHTELLFITRQTIDLTVPAIGHPGSEEPR